MRGVTIRDYIGHAEELTAEQVRKLEPGEKVVVHSFDRQGTHQMLEMTVAWDGTKRTLLALDYYGTPIARPIRKETDRMCYTKGGVR